MPILGPTTTPPAGNTTITQPTTPAPGMRVTGADMVRGALRLIGALASGEQPSAAELQDGLAAGNQMFDAWNAERLALFQSVRQEFPLTIGTQAYTLGPGGDFDLPRPPKLDWASVLDLNNAAQPLERPVDIITDPQKWREIVLKQLSGMFPAGLFDDQGFPLRTLSLWPTPTTGTLQLVLYFWQALTSFPNAQTVVTFPPGYYEAIRFNLAVRLAPEFGKEPTASVLGLANAALARIKSANIISLEMECDEALLSGRQGSGWARFVSGR